MTSNRPYLIRALYEWIIDNGMTPHLLVDAGHASAEVPTEYVEDGRIVLNVSPTAVNSLAMMNDEVSFSARFGGVARDIRMHPDAVLGIYARENGKGMLFPESETAGGPDDTPPEGGKPSRPNLKIVK
jgi:stringent starvation protein B